MVRISDLRQLEIVNLADGKKLGNIKDLEINLEEGRIEAIIIPGPGKLFGIFGKESDYVIPWEDIKKIGVDIILVELNDNVSKRK